MVNYQSTRGHKDSLSFQDVILSGLAPDKGLYLPDSITLENLAYLTQEDLSYENFVKTILSNGNCSPSLKDGFEIMKMISYVYNK